jgi:uncharacterized protein YbbK (DUF523 family)
MKLAHEDDPLSFLRSPTTQDPLRILISGCMAGLFCGVDGSDNGMGSAVADLLVAPRAKCFRFCPEDHALGTPRGTPDIHGGDGGDVLAGRASVLDETGRDISAEMIAGARAMVEFARDERIEVAVLVDMSGACGSQVISDGSRFAKDRRYRRGTGVAAAALDAAGFAILSQRDFRTLGLIRGLVGARPEVFPPHERDHHETDWYRDYFFKDTRP